METPDTEPDDKSKAVMLLGRDIRKVTCFKNSVLFGIYSGVAAGLVTFLFTSRVRLATNVAMGSYMGVSLSYWCFCRYTFVKNKYAITAMQNRIQETRGTRAIGTLQNNDQQKMEDA
ncbi:Protein FAM36A [Harpegnathos saltator]|uniref:Cytochrome c oxidase assembly protein COX20, mitochondrial n=1 Tax=Harpegnathos saltator TaxID=610380 RepID=E2C9V3_HARSA|nr:Protein FAM36A [Harpegnathos saltator]